MVIANSISATSDFITALQLLVWTGARPEEVCQLRMSDVNLDARRFKITNISDDTEARDRFTKNEHSVRAVPIHPNLVPIMDAHLEHIAKHSKHDLLFPSFEPELDSGRYRAPPSKLIPDHSEAEILRNLQEELNVCLPGTLRNAVDLDIDMYMVVQAISSKICDCVTASIVPALTKNICTAESKAISEPPDIYQRHGS